MKQRFKNSRIVGLEFDSGSIRGVELHKKGNNLVVTARARVAIPENAVIEGQINDVAAVIAGVNQLWSQGHFRAKDVIIGVSNQGVIIRFASFPKVTPNRLDNLIRFQAQEHLPVPLDSVVLDYEVIGTKSDGERELLDVLLVAGRKEMLEGFLQVLQQTALQPKEIEVLPLTLLRFLKNQAASQAVAIVDLGEGVSNMVIAVEGKPRLARMMPMGTGTAKQWVAVTTETEEQPLVSNEEFKDLVNSIRATIGFYQSHKDARPVDQIILSGRDAAIGSLAIGLEAQLRLPVMVAKPLENLNLQYEDSNSADFLEYGMAAALACRGWEG